MKPALLSLPRSLRPQLVVPGRSAPAPEPAAASPLASAAATRGVAATPGFAATPTFAATATRPAEPDRSPSAAASVMSMDTQPPAEPEVASGLAGPEAPWAGVATPSPAPNNARDGAGSPFGGPAWAPPEAPHVAMPNFTFGAAGGDEWHVGSGAPASAPSEDIFGEIQNTAEGIFGMSLGPRGRSGAPRRRRGAGGKGRGRGAATATAAGTASGAVPSASAPAPAPQAAAATPAAAPAPAGPEDEDLQRRWDWAMQCKDCAAKSYAEGDFEAAVQWYRYAAEVLQGVAGDARAVGVPGQAEVAGQLSRALSNRAAAQLMLARPWAALADAAEALRVDAGNARARVRVGTCLLRLGLLAGAGGVLRAAEDELRGAGGAGAGARALEDSSSRLRELGSAQAAVEGATEEVLRSLKATPPLSPEAHAALTAAMRRLESVAPLMANGEAVRALQACALMRLGQGEEAARLAEDTPGFLGAAEVAAAEQALGASGAPAAFGVAADAPARMARAAARWRASVRALAAAAAGDGEACVAAVGSLEGVAGEGGPEDLGLSPAVWAAAVIGADEARALRDSLRRVLGAKEAGNVHYRAQRWQEAAQAYSEALGGELLGGPPVVAAVLHSNRAACFQSMGRMTDALADACRAHALCPTYPRALSRLASLLMLVRRADDATTHLRALQRLPGCGADVQVTAAAQSAACLARCPAPPSPSLHSLWPAAASGRGGARPEGRLASGPL